MAIELIIFDLAGTTVEDNKDVHKVLQAALKSFGVSVSLEDANAVMGIPKPVAIEQLLKKVNYPFVSGELIKEIHEFFVTEMIEFYRHDPGLREKTGVSETFRALKAHGIKIGVDTGFDRQITDPLLQRMGWKTNGLLDVSVTSDEVTFGRPHPDMIFRAMASTGVKAADRVAKVGDTSYDLQEGSSAGCGLVIGITSGAFTREQLLAEPHTHLIDNIPEILPILGVKQAS